MARAKTAYTCTECGGRSSKWQGQCPHCSAWNTLVETVAVPVATRFRTVTGAVADVRTLASVETRAEPRSPTGLEEFDRVLGGGLVPGAVVLLGGDPGIGKSTLLLTAMDRLARLEGGRPVLYVSGEESLRQSRLRGERLGALSPGLLLFAEIDADLALAAA